MLAALARDPAVVQHLIEQGRYVHALPILEIGRAVYPERVESLNQLGNAYSELGRLREAQTALERALEIERARGEVSTHQLAITLNNLGLVYNKLQLLHKAEDAMSEAAGIYRSLEDRLGEAQTTMNLASTYRVEGRLLDAEPLYRAALAIREQMLVATDRNIAVAANNLGVLLIDLKRWDEAAPLLARALSIWERTLGERHPQTLAALNNLGVLYLHLGRFDLAEPYLARAVKIGAKILPPDHPNLAAYMNSYGLALRKLDRKTEARQFQEAAREAREHYDRANALGFTVDARQTFH